VTELLGLADRRPLWVAGSTHPGEEEQVLAAFRAARTAVPSLALLLAPRHIERTEAVLELVRANGWQAERRSLAPATATPCDVLVLDTMGELSSLYALGQVVFVGGSLASIGGHDILQPIFQGCPTLFGPHMHNQQDLARLALEAGAAVQVADAEALGAEITRLLTDPAAHQQLRANGERLREQNRGAAVECAHLLVELARSTGSTTGKDDTLASAAR
jgi:3-deoxy-D-manno-octulosonic-acid transferase